MLTESSSSDESEDEEKPKEKPRARRSPEPPRRPPPQDDESSDSMDWGSSSSDSSSSSDDEARGAATIRERFLKTKAEVGDDEERDKRRAKRREERRDVRIGKSSKRDQADDGGEWETVRKGAATSDKPKMFAKVCTHYLYIIFVNSMHLARLSMLRKRILHFCGVIFLFLNV